MDPNYTTTLHDRPAVLGSLVAAVMLPPILTQEPTEFANRLIFKLEATNFAFKPSLFQCFYHPTSSSSLSVFACFPCKSFLFFKSRTTKLFAQCSICSVICSALLFSAQRLHFLSPSYHFSFFLSSRAIGISVKLQAIDHSMLQCFILFPLFVSDPDLAWVHYSSHLIPLSY